MTILTKDPVGEYPLPIGGSDGSLPTDERIIAVVSPTVSVVSIIKTRAWYSDYGTRAWYDATWPGRYVWVAVEPSPGFSILYDYYGYEITYVTVPATTGSPYVPATISPSALAAYYNAGWNTWAKSISSIRKGQYLEFTVDTAAVGAMVIFSYLGKDGQFGTASTNQGFVITSNQISLIDSEGTVTAFGSNSVGTQFFMYRLLDGRIAFRVGSYIHTNALVLSSPSASVYAYGMLYRAFDSITFAAIADATITEVTHTVTLSAGSELRAATGTGARLAGSSTLTTVITKTVETTMTGTGYLESEVDTLTRGTATLPLYTSLGADYEYGHGAGTLPSYEQPQIMPEYGFAALPYYFGYAYGSDHDVGSASASIPLYINLGADYTYGFGDGVLPLYTSGATEGITGEFVMFDLMLTTATTTLAIDLILVLNSSGTLKSSFSMTREQALAFISSVTGGDQYTFVGTFSMEMLTDLRGNSLQISTIGDAPDLQGNGVVWVVNLATRASSQYEDYGFNSFFNHNGQAYGVANDGIYSLGGDTDASAYIPALVDLGKTNLGTPKVKYVPNVYMGISSTDKMVLKVIAGSRTYYYTARSSATEMRNQRFDIGKGLSANYWQLVLENSNGCDFELAEIEFTPITSSRRI